jgi:hypothetical protein
MLQNYFVRPILITKENRRESISKITLLACQPLSVSRQGQGICLSVIASRPDFLFTEPSVQ